jgi:hypothetical protein
VIPEGLRGALVRLYGARPEKLKAVVATHVSWLALKQMAFEPSRFYGKDS